jgi:hypothetical protein
MTDFRMIFENLRRPRILMQAARLGLAEYRRERDLRRLVTCGSSPEETVHTLISEEERMERTRLSGDAAYSISRHIEVLIALLAEARLLRRGGLV